MLILKKHQNLLICSQALWWEKYRHHTKSIGVCLRDQDFSQSTLQVSHSQLRVRHQQWAQQACCWTSCPDTPNAWDGPQRFSSSRSTLVVQRCCLVPHSFLCCRQHPAGPRESSNDPGNCRKEGSIGTAGSPAASSSTLPHGHRTQELQKQVHDGVTNLSS